MGALAHRRVSVAIYSGVEGVPDPVVHVPTVYCDDSDIGERAVIKAVREAAKAQGIDLGPVSARHDRELEWEVTATARIRKTTITLYATGMGNVTEDDFDAWAGYVERNIGALTSLDVTVEQARFDEAGYDDCGHVEPESVKDALRVLWERFCADASAWPAAKVPS